MILYFILLCLISVVLSPGPAFADVTYFYSYTTGQDVRFSSITVTGATVTGAGLRQGPTFTYPATAALGTTAISPIFSGDTLTEFHIFKNFVGANNKPAISRLEVNLAGQLQNEQASPRLKPTNFNILDAFDSGAENRLLVVVKNDVFAAKLNADGIAPGSKRPIFRNEADFLVVSSAMYQDGDLGVQGTFLPAPSLSISAIPRLLFRASGEQCLCVQPNSGADEECDCRAAVEGESKDHSLDVHHEDDDDDDDDDELSFAPRQQGGTALIVSRFFKGLGTTAPQSQVRLQVVDLTTGNFGPEKAISKFAPSNPSAENFRSIAMTEFLVLYTALNKTCGQMILKAQQIDENGNKVGAAKTVVNCSKLPPNTVSVGVYGLDMIEP